MDVKERRPYCSLTKSRREKERRYTNSSADNEECRVPTQKSYSSSETLKAFDHDSSRLLYGNRVKDLVHRETDEYTRQGQNFTLRQLGVCEPATRRGLAFCAEMGLPHRGYSISAGSDADTENEAVMSPEHAMRLWGRGVKSGRSSCLSSRSNSALTLTDTEHENKSDSENGHRGIRRMRSCKKWKSYLRRINTYDCHQQYENKRIINNTVHMHLVTSLGF
uniref:Teneurin transmembrane protein 3 n=2 Tax=Canis lupus familiaris TaxID=9615 RepID=A0A8P0PFF1_CANLF